MKIKRITLYNIGPYIDKNEFCISTDDKGKNIILIGGKNGAGKTTFFKAIKTCLYGCKVWGFEAPGKEYYSIITSLVNMRMQYDTSVKAYIELELFFDDGKEKHSYILHREWNRGGKNIKEEFYITKDNDGRLEIGEQADFSNYLLSIIPPDMFNFYFFDGEAIDDFFLGNNGGKNFKNAFLKLYGLDTISLMVENFERYSKKTNGSNLVYGQYQNIKNEIVQKEENLTKLKEQKSEVDRNIDLLQIQLHARQEEYTREGGISTSEWRELNAEVAKEEAKREELNRYIKEAANHYLPFIITENCLRSVLEKLNAEQEAKKKEIFVEMLKSQQFIVNLENFFAQKGVEGDTARAVVDFIYSNSLAEESGERYFDFSDSQTQKLVGQIYEKLDFDSSIISKKLKEHTASVNKSKKLRDKLSGSSIDGFEEFTKERSRIEKEIGKQLIAVEKLNQEIQTKEVDLDLLKKNYEKIQEEYEKLLKNKSIEKLSTRAIFAYSLLEEKLIMRQGKLLQEEFIKCFSSIINKENFLDGIVIDKNINVIPYKFIDVTFLQIENYLKANEQSKFLGFFDNSYLKEINDLRLGDKQQIRLPSPITSPFSQGERQVYIMSIYLALLKTSRKDIPFFIDTPFARIDSNHRDKIVKEFFMSLNDQIFILSTDEEVVGQYKDMMSGSLSEQFLLNIDDYGKTSIINNRYFEV